MHINITWPKKEYTINIHTKHAEWLDNQAAKEERTVDNVIMTALVWYQRIQELPGARDAVIALLPKKPSKMAPMPTLAELDEAIARLKPNNCEPTCGFYPDCACGDNEGYRGK